jgi:hypothetical protein
MNKRFIASVLSGCFALSTASALAAIPAEIEGTRFEDAVSVLSALKIMNGDENGEYRLDDTIIRSELTKMAVTAMGMEAVAQSSKGNRDFDDVGIDHWANGYIHTAVNLGIVEGDGDGNFRPNEEITYREAVAVMVRAAGYEHAAQSRGGYPKGHIAVANENKMLKSVEGTSEEPISRGNVAMLTNNTLETKKMEQTGFGSSPSYEVTDKTLLSDNLSTEKINGQIKAVGPVALSGNEPVNENQVKVDDEVYDIAYPVSNLLGYNAVCYIQKNSLGEKELILALTSSSKNKTIKISDDQFVKLTKKGSYDAVEYYESTSSSKTSTASIASDAQIIYNNRGAEFSLDLINLTGKAAYMTMLDSNGDNVYDIVFVTEYSNIVLDYVSSGKAIGMDGTAIRFDDIKYKMYHGFNEIEPDELRKWDILSVSESLDKEYTEIYVTRNTVKGKVTSINEDGYVIDDTEYKAAKSLSDTITLGMDTEFCLDISGKIAAVKSVSNVSDAYAYLTNAYKNESGDNVIIKITDKTGEEMTLTLADRVKLNGSTVKADEVLSSLVKESKVVKQLITYARNTSGKVTEINIANNKSESGAADTEHFTLNLKLDNALYTASTSKLGNIRITDKTIVFDVSDESNIKVADKSVFDNNQTYSGYVYDMSESYSASVIVLVDTAFKPAADAQLAIVKSISSGTNKDDEKIDILTALTDGKEVKLNAVDSETLVKDGGKKLAAGDVIRYKTDSAGEIAGISVVFDTNSRDNEFKSTPEKDLEIVYGKVTKKFDDSINVTVNNGSAVNYVVDSDVKYYSVDCGAKNGVVLSSFSEIAAYDADDNNRVLIRIYEDTVKEIVIIK